MTHLECSLLLGLLALLALLTGAEVLIVALAREPEADPEGDTQATGWLRLIRDSGSALTGIELAQLTTNFCLAWLTAATVARWLPPWAAGSIALVAVFAGLALSEILHGLATRAFRPMRLDPRAPRPPWRLAPFVVLAAACRPLGALVAGVVHREGKSAEREPEEPAASLPALSSEEIRSLVEHASRHGALVRGESRVLLNLVALGTEPVSSYMTPRTDMHVLDARWPEERIHEMIRRSGHRRYPVVEGDYDKVLGTIVAKEFCLGPERDLEACLRPLPFVPESKVAGAVFQEMRAAGNHLALVVDEYGGVEGMVTLNGMVSRLLGKLPTEEAAESRGVLRLEDRRWLIDGAFPVESLNAELGLDLPTRPDVTLGGLVFSLIGHLPSTGERVETRGLRFEVLSVRRNRIASIEMRRLT